MKLLNSEDMRSLHDKANAAMGGSPDATNEMFEAWGFDPEAVMETVVMAAISAVRTNGPVNDADEYADAMLDAVIIGFVLGCTASMEVETRKQTGDET